MGEGVVVRVDPGAGGVEVDELEAQRAHAAVGGVADRFELRAGDPQRRVGPLQRLRNHVAQREVEVVAVVLPALFPEHRQAGLDRLLPHDPLVAEAAAEGVQFGDARAFAEPQFDAAVRDQVEGGDPFPRPVPGGWSSTGRCRGRGGCSWCAATPRRETPRAPNCANTPPGSGAPPPRRSRNRAGPRVRSAPASSGAGGAPSPVPKAWATGARRRCRISWQPTVALCTSPARPGTPGTRTARVARRR